MSTPTDDAMERWDAASATWTQQEYQAAGDALYHALDSALQALDRASWEGEVRAANKLRYESNARAVIRAERERDAWEARFDITNRDRLDAEAERDRFKGHLRETGDALARETSLRAQAEQKRNAALAERDALSLAVEALRDAVHHRDRFNAEQEVAE